MGKRPSLSISALSTSARRLVIGVLAAGLLMAGLTTLPAAADDTSTLESGLSFDGSTQYVQFAKPLASAPQTIELWLKIPNAGNKREIIYSNYSDPNGVSIELSVNGQLRYYERLGAIDFITGPDLRDDKWHHVVLERDLANSKVSFYVDGSDVGDKTVTFPATTVVPTEASFLGQDYRASMRFQGEIGEVRDWSTLRTPDELAATATTELTGNEPGLMDDWGLDEPYDPSANSYVVHDRGPGAIDGTVVGFVPPAHPTTNIVDVDFTAGTPVEHSQGLPVTTYGTPTIANDDGAGGDVATFNGTTDAYSIPLAAQWPKLYSGLTTECVFRLNAAPTGSDYLCSGANSGGIDMWVNGTTLTYGLFVAGAYRRATATIDLHRWYDAVMVWDRSTVTLYLNGTPVSRVAAAGAVGLPTPAAAQDLILGADAATSGTFENPAAVSIKRAQIWDGSFTAHDVTKLYDLPTAAPGGTDDTATLESGLTFDGSSQYVQFATPLLTAPETIELWLKIPDAGDKREIIYSDYSDANGVSIELSATGQLRYYERLGAIDFITGPDLRDDKWHHVVLERDLDHNKISFYVDGTDVGDKTVTFPATTVVPGTAHWLGQDTRATMRFEGEVGDVRDWATLRTPAELAATATTELTGDEPGLMDDWSLDDAFASGATDTTVHDRGPDAIDGRLVGFTPPVPLLVHDLTTAAVAAGSPVSQRLTGLWSRPGSSTAPTFSKIDGDPWLQVSPDGVVTGTPTSKAQGTTGVITVKADDGSFSDTITVEVPVLGNGERPQITAASWNLWDDGSHVNASFAKQLTAITDSGLDLIGVQESDGKGAQQLADALGWYAYQSSGDLGIVSAFPISNVVEPTADVPAAAVTVTVNGEPVRVLVAHLDEGDSESTRTTQAKAITAELAPDLAKASTTPVIVLDDLATTATSVTGVFAAAGLTDTGLRDGPTYSLVAAGGATQRVDSVDYRGGLRVLGSESYYTGSPSSTDPAADNWPSDHAAAVTEFELAR